MFLCWAYCTRNEQGMSVDFKGVGYIVSIVSVFLIGAVAWPKAADPQWMRTALVAGMATSVIGMGLRYIAHRKEQRELRRAESRCREPEIA